MDNKKIVLFGIIVITAFLLGLEMLLFLLFSKGDQNYGGLEIFVLGLAV